MVLILREAEKLRSQVLFFLLKQNNYILYNMYDIQIGYCIENIFKVIQYEDFHKSITN